MVILETGLWETDNALATAIGRIPDQTTLKRFDISSLEDDDPKWDKVAEQILSDGRCLSI